MEEEETELINLINSTWEEMAPSTEEGSLDRMEEGALSCQAARLFLPIRYVGAGGFGTGASVDLMATHWPWTLTSSLPSQYVGSTRDE